jgi:hypothetical protein
MMWGRNAGPVAGLLIAALVVVRFVVLRGGGHGLAHGSGRSVLGLVLVFALIGARVFLFRRR